MSSSRSPSFGSDEIAAAIIAKADQQYRQNEMVDNYTYLLQYKDADESAVLWRLARVAYEIGKYYTPDKAKAKKIAEEGLAYAKRSVELDGSSAEAHQWAGVVLSFASELEGYKKKIEMSYEMRDYFKKACELNPQDPISQHTLGRWCYEVAGVPWYMRKVASYIFATPPTSTFDEALQHFLRAEEVRPGFFHTNWLLIAKCYLQLKKKDEAKKWLNQLVDSRCINASDLEAQEEAKKLLAGL